MYHVIDDNLFDYACTQTDRVIYTKCEIELDGQTQTITGDGINGRIVSFELDSVFNEDGALSLGTACMDSFKMVIRDVDDGFNGMGATLRPYIGIEDEVMYGLIWCPLGEFYVIDSETNDDYKTLTLTAYDGMYKLSARVNWSVLNLSRGALDLLNQISELFEIQIEMDWDDSGRILRTMSELDYICTADEERLVVAPPVGGSETGGVINAPIEGLTYRDLVGMIAGLYGRSAHFTRDGKLRIAWYNDALDADSRIFTITRDVQHMHGAKINLGGAVYYSSIVSGDGMTTVLPYDYSGNAITYYNPYIDAKTLTGICDEVYHCNPNWSRMVIPCEVEWRSNPRLEVGDIISVEDATTLHPYHVYVMERVLTLTGGLKEKTICYARTEDSATVYHNPNINETAGAISNISYNTLNNKPSIEGHVLTGNMTVKDLGITPLTNSQIQQAVNAGAVFSGTQYLDEAGLSYFYGLISHTASGVRDVILNGESTVDVSGNSVLSTGNGLRSSGGEIELSDLILDCGSSTRGV